MNRLTLARNLTGIEYQALVQFFVCRPSLVPTGDFGMTCETIGRQQNLVMVTPDLLPATDVAKLTALAEAFRAGYSQAFQTYFSEESILK